MDRISFDENLLTTALSFTIMHFITIIMFVMAKTMCNISTPTLFTTVWSNVQDPKSPLIQISQSPCNLLELRKSVSFMVWRCWVHLGKIGRPIGLFQYLSFWPMYNKPSHYFEIIKWLVKLLLVTRGSTINSWYTTTNTLLDPFQ